MFLLMQNRDSLKNWILYTLVTNIPNDAPVPDKWTHQQALPRHFYVLASVPIKSSEQARSGESRYKIWE